MTQFLFLKKKIPKDIIEAHDKMMEYLHKRKTHLGGDFKPIGRKPQKPISEIYNKPVEIPIFHGKIKETKNEVKKKIKLSEKQKIKEKEEKKKVEKSKIKTIKEKMQDFGKYMKYLPFILIGLLILFFIGKRKSKRVVIANV